LEQTRLDRDEWKRSCERESAIVEEARVECGEVRRELEVVRGEGEGAIEQLRREKEKARNLQSVLQDFQAGE